MIYFLLYVKILTNSLAKQGKTRVFLKNKTTKQIETPAKKANPKLPYMHKIFWNFSKEGIN